jgi:hypothetical protein
MASFGPLACGGDGGPTYADKCGVACDPSAVMACVAMNATSCKHDCEALTAGLSATCATCVTQGNAWLFALDHRSTGTTSCHGYAFPSITDTSSIGCATACK